MVAEDLRVQNPLVPAPKTLFSNFFHTYSQTLSSILLFLSFCAILDLAPFTPAPLVPVPVPPELAARPLPPLSKGAQHEHPTFQIR